jgi:hypothetical protein
MRYIPIRRTPKRYLLMRCVPIRRTLKRCMPIRHAPEGCMLEMCTPKRCMHVRDVRLRTLSSSPCISAIAQRPGKTVSLSGT